MAERLWQIELAQASNLNTAIMALQAEQRRLRASATERVAKMIGREGQRIHLGGWACPGSPTKACIYLPEEDWLHDNCIFCHDPEERK